MPTPVTPNRSVTPSQPLAGPIAELVRHGQDSSLRALQVWADLARQLGLFPGPGGTADQRHLTPNLATERFEQLLVVQREVVAELVAAQRHLIQQVLAARRYA